MNRPTCFVDSVGWIAMLNVSDELYKKAENEYKRLMRSGFRFLTSTAVLNEVANALSKVKFRNSVVEFYKKLQESQRVEIVFIDENIWALGWDLYENRPDKEWSLTDCTSIVIMEKQGLIDAFTNDKHFEQAGFNAILRSSQ